MPHASSSLVILAKNRAKCADPIAFDVRMYARYASGSPQLAAPEHVAPSREPLTIDGLVSAFPWGAPAPLPVYPRNGLRRFGEGWVPTLRVAQATQAHELSGSLPDLREDIERTCRRGKPCG